VSPSSIEFLGFVGATWLVFAALPDRLRWAWLLAVSYAFYALLRAPHLLAVLLAVTGVAYVAGLAVERAAERARRVAFWSAVCVELALLASVKYLPALAQALGLRGFPTWALAVGASYYVFQAIGYLADVHLGTAPAERHLGRFALYLSFFPRVLQGPIERAGDLLPQLRRSWSFDYEDARRGLLLIAWGAFKKVLVAERLGVVADAVYSDVHGHSPVVLLFGTYAYAFQIYCDFSGYTDIARGTARLFGIRLSQNFDRPYAATSIAEFWRRWHMSFSRWLLDYLFRPLQLHWRDWRAHGTALALLVTFLLSGVWHDARWTFVVWGLLHGVYLAASTYYRPVQDRLRKRLGKRAWNVLAPWRALVVFHLVCAGWVFFRAERVDDALHVIVQVLGSAPGDLAAALAALKLPPWPFPGANLAGMSFTLLALAVVLLERRWIALVLERPFYVRWAAYGALTLAFAWFARPGGNTFIYFAF
jgi:alginate O-acetyltransferase complex protein AlgI